MGVVEDIGNLLSTSGVGTLGSSLRLHYLTETTGAAVFVLESPVGLPPARLHGQDVPEWERARVQIVARSTKPGGSGVPDPRTARGLAHDAWLAVEAVANETLSGSTYLRCEVLQSPFMLGRDDNGRAMFAFNAECWRRPPGPPTPPANPPLAVTHLTDGSATNTTAPATQSVSPTAAATVLVWVAAKDSASIATPSLSGLGASWTLIASEPDVANIRRLFLFAAQTATYTPGAVTVTFAEAQEDVIWSVDEIANSATGTVTGIVVRPVARTRSDTLYTATSVELQGELSTDNVFVAGAIIGSGGNTVESGDPTNWTELGEAATGNITLQTQYSAAGDPVAEWLWDHSAHSFCIAAEVRHPDSAAVAGDVVSLTSGTSAATTTEYTSASITPTANRLLVACFVGERASSPGVATVTDTGIGLTWEAITSQVFDSEASPTNRLTIAAAKTGATPGTGTVKFTVPANNTAASWIVFEVDGADLTGSAAAAILQAVGDATEAATSLSLPITTPASDSFIVGVFGRDTAGGAGNRPTPGLGFALLEYTTAGGFVAVEWRKTSDTTVDMSLGVTADWGGVALEIAAA